MERNEEVYHILGKIEAKGKEYHILHIPKPNENTLRKLWKLKRENGGMLQSIIYDPNKNLEAVVIAGPRLGIYSWTAISNDTHYNDGGIKWEINKMLNTYTKVGYRHLGFGSTTRQSAINICKSRKQKYCWCDIKKNWWHYV